MFRSKFLNILMSFLVIASMTLGTTGQGVAAQGQQDPPPPSGQTGGGNLHGKVTPAERQAAAERLKAAYKAAGISTQPSAVMAPGGVPDYFGVTPNYANSPLPTLDVNGVPLAGTGMRKFVDTLPGLTPAGINDLNQYIPVAEADTITYPGSDYYEIALVEYKQQLHLDLPPTTIRGYVQISTQVTPGAHVQLFFTDGVTPILDNKGQPVYGHELPQYLGPVILAHRYDPAFAAGATLPGGGVNGQPTRVKFSNYLPTGIGGNLFIPMDSTYMGAGEGPTGEVTGISILTGGAGYTSVPTVTISGGTTGVNAKAVATILNGVVNTLHITDPGTLYASAPTVTITGGGATTDATAALSWVGATPAVYSENRGNLHLHGGNTPWISDGTPDQWTTPATEGSPYPDGVSVVNVPDMPDPGPGSLTLFYTNEQSARLMFYHDHAYGITRLNVYAGEAAGYLLQDPTERALVANGTLPPDTNQIPLVIQDKTFVPPTPQLATEDPTWDIAKWGGEGNFWFPHVYMPNQNPYDMSGANAVGRWDYGSWFWPPLTSLTFGPVPNPLAGTTPLEGPVNPGTPTPSGVPEGFMDTPLINGTAYPVLNVNPEAYRFQILNAANDRFWNLQLYQTSSIVGSVTLTNPGSGYTDIPLITVINSAGDTTGQGATAIADVDLDDTSPTFGQLLGVSLWTVGSGYTANPLISIAPPTTLGGVQATATASVYTAPTEVGMVPFTSSQNAITPFPSGWYVAGNPFTMDDRNGGVPDPTKRGPALIQIGTEGGVLPAPALIKNTAVNFNYNRRDITVLNVLNHGLFMGPAERADVVIDFSNFAGKTLILYNDSPAPVPAGDPRNDYFTGSPDLTSTGGAPSIVAGYGPNTRTLMKIVVGAGASSTAPLDDYNTTTLATLKTAIPAAFAASQDAPIVSQSVYNAAYGATYPTNAYVRISDTSMTFTPVGQTTPVTLNLGPKAIQELFTLDYGRMNATLGVEIPNTNFTVQTTIPLGYIDPGTELLQNSAVGAPIGSLADGTQLWKITHNGVDTHTMHFHMFTVQVINRVGWDGAIRPPEANEIGWKDTVRMSPLEDVVVAFRPIIPVVPFQVPNSYRAIDVTRPIGSTMGFGGVDPNNQPSAVVNKLINYGWEYVWHCHLLGHEENDMMRPMLVAVAPSAPITLTATRLNLTTVRLNWVNTANNATTYIIQRADDAGFLTNLATFDTGGVATTYTDITATGPGYYYRVAASNVIGGNEPGWPSMTANSAFTAGLFVATPVAPSGLTATLLSGTSVRLNWTDNATNETGFQIYRSVNGGALALLATAPALAGTGPVTYTDTTVTGGNTYAYIVRAANIFGTSAFTPSASVTVPTAIPAAPTALSATLLSGTSARLNWTDNATNETGFQVYRSVNGGALALLATAPARAGTGAVTYTDTTVTGGNTYAYIVRAANILGTSAFTPSASVTVPTVVPAAPTALTATLLSGTSARLNWTDNATNESGFQVYRSVNGGALALLATAPARAGTGAVTYTDTTVTGGNTYAYIVRAANILGTSAFTPSASVTVPTAIPAAPTALTRTVLAGPQVRLNWTDNATNESGFEVYRSVNGGGYTLLATAPARAGTGAVTYTDTAVTAGNTYRYEVRAVNVLGRSAFTIIITAAL